MRSLPALAYANRDNEVLEYAPYQMLGRSWTRLVKPTEGELIRLPAGSKFFSLPRTAAVGWDPDQAQARTLKRVERKLAQGVAAFLAPAYTRILLPAFVPQARYATLPLWAYTAVGWQDNSFWVPAMRVDENTHWDPDQFDDRVLLPRVSKMQQRYPENRLLALLANCALNYHCFAAKNLFYGRWEMPLPTAPTCNAGCQGCLSHQPTGGCMASMQRIAFVPTPAEIIEITVPHLEQAAEPIASFGQGCEGEPLLQADTLEKAIKGIRQATRNGTLNLNTNGSMPAAIRRLGRAGLDSIRFSLNSTDPELYNLYFRPRGYTFKDVLKSIAMAKGAGLYVSLNLFVFPGLTDREEEVEGLYRIIGKYGVDMIQLRNLNIDPELYTRSLPGPKGHCVGIYRFIEGLKRDFPALTLGYFNRPKDKF